MSPAVPDAWPPFSATCKRSGHQCPTVATSVQHHGLPVPPMCQVLMDDGWSSGPPCLVVLTVHLGWALKQGWGNRGLRSEPQSGLPHVCGRLCVFHPPS